jgi:hypothetical protein
MNFMEIVNKVQSRVNCAKSGSCGIFARFVCSLAERHGLLDFKVVFGHVKCVQEESASSSGYSWTAEHIWIEYNGYKIDPTRLQFPNFKTYLSRRKIYSPEEFLEMKDFILFPSWVKPHLNH